MSKFFQANSDDDSSDDDEDKDSEESSSEEAMAKRRIMFRKASGCLVSESSHPFIRKEGWKHHSFILFHSNLEFIQR